MKRLLCFFLGHKHPDDDFIYAEWPCQRCGKKINV